MWPYVKSIPQTHDSGAPEGLAVFRIEVDNDVYEGITWVDILTDFAQTEDLSMIAPRPDVPYCHLC